MTFQPTYRELEVLVRDTAERIANGVTIVKPEKLKPHLDRLGELLDELNKVHRGEHLKVKELA